MKTMLDVVGAVKDYVDTHAGGGGDEKMIKGIKTETLISEERFIPKMWFYAEVKDTSSAVGEIYTPAVMLPRTQWTDGKNLFSKILTSSSGSSAYTLLYDKANDIWRKIDLGGKSSYSTTNEKTSVWTDGENIYYSEGTSSHQHVFNPITFKWEDKTWNGLTSFYGSNIWTDGENIYHSSITDQYVLDKTTSTWSPKTWNGLSNFNGTLIWTDGENIYYSYGTEQYVLDKTSSTWSSKTWNGLTSFYGSNIWTDGENIYYNDDDKKSLVLCKTHAIR